MTHDVAIIFQCLGALNLIALTFIAWRLRAPVQVHIHQPAMTVQSPPAILPPELMDLMQRLDGKMQPPAQPLVGSEQLDKLVAEAVELVEHVKGVKGPDKFRNARTIVMQRATALGLSVDERTLALSIESAVLARRA